MCTCMASHMIMKRNCSPMLVTVWLTVTIMLCWGQVTTSTNQDSLIVEAPANQTVPARSTAIFSCRVTGILRWVIDRAPITDATRNAFCSDRGVCVNVTLDNSPNETDSLLLVDAIEENNGSMIRCLASETLTSAAEESEAAILKIFDRPEPPTNLVFSPVSYLRLNLSWDAPFLFPGTEISYTVTIRNVNTSEAIQKEGLEVTYYIFNGTEGSSMCDVYHFSVAAVNRAGRSDCSENISSHLPTLPNTEASMESLRHDVIFEDGSAAASIRISFEPAGTCGGYLDPVTDHDVILHGDNTNATVSEINFEDGKVNFEITNAQVNFQYSISIVAFNSVGNTTSEESECYTTDVQDASISMNENDIVVTCSFAQGSQAQGCQVQLNSPMENITLNISRLNPCSILELSYPPTLYDICALDWEADGTIGELCVPVTVDLSQFASCGNPSDKEPSEEPGPEPRATTKPLIIGVITAVVGVTLIVVLGAIMGYLCKRARQDRANSNGCGKGMMTAGMNNNHSTTEHWDSQATIETTQLSDTPPHIYDQVDKQGNRDSGEMDYSHTPRVQMNNNHSTTEHSNSQATIETTQPSDTSSHTYDCVQNCSKQGAPASPPGHTSRRSDQDNGEMTYSHLSRSSQLSSMARVEFKHDPEYSTLNQDPVYAQVENNSKPHGILTSNQETYCVIDDVKISRTSAINHDSRAVSVSVSDTDMIPENEILYEQPTAGTSVC